MLIFRKCFFFFSLLTETLKILSESDYEFWLSINLVSLFHLKLVWIFCSRNGQDSFIHYFRFAFFFVCFSSLELLITPGPTA